MTGGTLRPKDQTSDPEEPNSDLSNRATTGKSIRERMNAFTKAAPTPGNTTNNPNSSLNTSPQAKNREQIINGTNTENLSSNRDHKDKEINNNKDSKYGANSRIESNSEINPQNIQSVPNSTTQNQNLTQRFGSAHISGSRGMVGSKAPSQAYSMAHSSSRERDLKKSVSPVQEVNNITNLASKMPVNMTIEKLYWGPSEKLSGLKTKIS